MSELNTLIRTAREDTAEAVDETVSNLFKIDTDIGGAIVQAETNLVDLTKRTAIAALSDLSDEESKDIQEDPNKLIAFMAELVDIEPRSVTNTDLKVGLRSLAELRLARTQLRQIHTLVQQATKIATGITLKLVTAGVA